MPAPLLRLLFAEFGRERVDALFIAGDGFFYSRGVQFATLAVRDRMPASYVTREMVEAGLLMSYGTIFLDMFRQVGIYTGSILKGVKPADIPVLILATSSFGSLVWESRIR
jgi:putative ABC transport system substrate-binding protein